MKVKRLWGKTTLEAEKVLLSSTSGQCLIILKSGNKVMEKLRYIDTIEE